MAIEGILRCLQIPAFAELNESRPHCLAQYCTSLRLGELFRNAVSSDNWDLADRVQFPARWWMHFPSSPWTERLLCNFHPVLTTRPIYCRD